MGWKREHKCCGTASYRVGDDDQYGTGRGQPHAIVCQGTSRRPTATEATGRWTRTSCRRVVAPIQRFATGPAATGAGQRHPVPQSSPGTTTKVKGALAALQQPSFGSSAANPGPHGDLGASDSSAKAERQAAFLATQGSTAGTPASGPGRDLRPA